MNEAVLSKGQKRIKMLNMTLASDHDNCFFFTIVESSFVATGEKNKPTRSEVEAPNMGISSRPCFKLGNQAVSLHEFIMDSAEVSCLETCPAISPLVSSKRHPPTFGEQTSPPKASFPQQNEAIRTISTLQ